MKQERAKGDVRTGSPRKLWSGVRTYDCSISHKVSQAQQPLGSLRKTRLK